MFSFVANLTGKLIRGAVDTVEEVVGDIANIPDELQKGYKEGFSEAEKKEIKDSKEANGKANSNTDRV